ncbi:MAG: hypothetical protein COA43_04910 [Robiginitomaculum sp.]|nr:MAG: hypothetical protein COA43_04910 [Robiginitomaculum sp.]
MKDFVLTSEEQTALVAITSRYLACDNEEHKRRRHDQTYYGWYGVLQLVRDPDHSGCFPKYVDGALVWVFKPPPKPWKVRGEFVARLIKSANGSMNNKLGLAGNIWPNTKTLNGETLYLKHLSVSGEINLDDIHPKRFGLGLDIHFEKIFLERLIAQRCTFGVVSFENCRATSVLMPNCHFQALAFKTLPAYTLDITPLKTPFGKERSEKLVSEVQSDVLEIQQGHKSAFSPDTLTYIQVKRGKMGEGDFGMIVLPNIKVKNDISFEGVRVTGLAEDKYIQEIQCMQRNINAQLTPMLNQALVLEDAEIGGSVWFVNSTRVNAEATKRHILSAMSSRPVFLEIPAFLNNIFDVDNSEGQLPFISMGGANLRQVKVQSSIVINQAWFLAPSPQAHNQQAFDDRTLMRMHINTPTKNTKIVLDLNGARFETLIVKENDAEVLRAINDFAIKDGYFKPDATDGTSFNDAQLALDTAMMARPLFFGNVNLDECQMKRAQFSSVWVSGIVSMIGTKIVDEIRFHTNCCTSRIGGLALGKQNICAHDTNDLANILVFAGCVLGSINDSDKALPTKRAYPPHPYWRIHYDEQKLSNANDENTPISVLIDGISYTHAIEKWNGTITSHPLIFAPKHKTTFFTLKRKATFFALMTVPKT